MTGQLRERLDDVRATISFQNDEFLSNETQSALQQFTNANVSAINITGTHPFLCSSILPLCLLLSSSLSFSSHSLPPPNPLPPPIPLNLLFYCSVSPFLSILPHPIPVFFPLSFSCHVNRFTKSSPPLQLSDSRRKHHWCSLTLMKPYRT